jgi:hypothetical protein
VLVAIATLTYWGYALRVPFINDDYVFLDAVRTRSFPSLWGFEQLTFGWWRPWSRELHYWLLQRGFGARELPFHVASFAIALSVLGAYFVLARRVAGARVAGLACAGVAALAAWAVPLVWNAGAQELWMLLFALLTVHAFAFGGVGWATVALAGALLSKETAAVVPGIALAAGLIVRRMPLRAALVRALPLVLIVLTWAIVHPALGGRMRAKDAAPPLAAARALLDRTDTTAALEVPVPPAAHAPELPAPLTTLVTRTLLVPFNLDHPLAPEHGWAPVAKRALPALVVLVLLVAWATSRPWGGSGTRAPSANSAASGADAARREALASRTRIVAFGVAWALCGWLPVLWPSLGWHAYYTLLGALGAWIAIAALLAERRTLAVALIAALVVLRAAQGATPSLDWGSEWYQNRAATFLDFMRSDLLRKQPTVPRHARLFFFDVPSNVGFLTAGGPALRVWYRDTTVSGGYLGQWTPRASGTLAGPDLFFRYDSTSGWVAIATGAEDTAAARRANQRWTSDHRELAAAFARGRAWRNAGEQYARVATTDPGEAEAAADAAVCFAMAGDSVTAARWFELASRAPGADDDIRRFAREFARHLRPRG